MIKRLPKLTAFVARDQCGDLPLDGGADEQSEHVWDVLPLKVAKLMLVETRFSLQRADRCMGARELDHSLEVEGSILRRGDGCAKDVNICALLQDLVQFDLEVAISARRRGYTGETGYVDEAQEAARLTRFVA